MRVNYKHPASRKERKTKRIQEVKEQMMQDDDAAGKDTAGSSKYDQLISKGLNSIKRKQIFKKHKRKDVQAEINELKIQSKKLNKKDLKQKAQKGKIAKKIKELKASLSRSGEADQDESE